MADASLLVNGKAYAGWKRVRVTRSIESISGSFELEVSDRWGEGAPWPILEEDACTVKLGDEIVLTGFVDRRAVSYDADGHTLSVSGRDAAGALVDCSALLDKWEFKGIPLLKMVQRVCDPFGISVTLQAGLTPAALPAPPKKLSIDPGDTAHDVIEKVCRLAGVLAVSDGRGGLVLTRAGSAHTDTDLVEGGNILSASGEFDASGRFSEYRVLGQHHGTDEFSGAKTARVKAIATDENVVRTSRKLVIRPESSVTTEQAKIRAAWEAKVRAARADAVSVTVQGWEQAAGSVWPVNALVRVESPTIGVHGDMLITQVSSTASDSGTTSEITLKRPDAFLAEQVIRKAVGDNYWKEIRRGV